MIDSMVRAAASQKKIVNISKDTVHHVIVNISHGSLQKGSRYLTSDIRFVPEYCSCADDSCIRVASSIAAKTIPAPMLTRDCTSLTHACHHPKERNM